MRQYRSKPILVEKPWGGEEIVHNSLGAPFGYCGKILTVLPNGLTSSLHFHRRKVETFRMLSGVLALEIYENVGLQAVEIVDRLRRGLHVPLPRLQCVEHLYVGEDVLTLPLNTTYRFWCAEKGEPAVFIEFSSPCEADDSIRMAPSGPVPTTEVDDGLRGRAAPDR